MRAGRQWLAQATRAAARVHPAMRFVSQARRSITTRGESARRAGAPVAHALPEAHALVAKALVAKASPLHANRAQLAWCSHARASPEPPARSHALVSPEPAERCHARVSPEPPECSHGRVS